jgi:hypothetical protein
MPQPMLTTYPDICFEPDRLMKPRLAKCNPAFSLPPAIEILSRELALLSIHAEAEADATVLPQSFPEKFANKISKDKNE